MNVEKLKISKARARDLWRKYREHLAYQTPVDQEIEKAYKAIAQGRTVIRAIESIRNAGLLADGRPRLAIARATAKFVEVIMGYESAEFRSNAVHYTATRSIIDVPNFRGANRSIKGEWIRAARAPMPIIPVHLRPRRGLFNYWTLWEVESWTAIPPRDPYLLRRLAGDMWLVVAAWDLTEVERAAMATRLNG